MTQVKTYKLPPTRLVPNSPRPLIHYPGFLSSDACTALGAHNLFASNGWQLQWVVRYAATQGAHYHSASHECMAVLSGSATIRFGLADDDDDDSKNGGIELQARPGDVFVIPAGVAHKTFRAVPDMPFELLTPGDGHSIAATTPDEVREMLARIEPSGFTMIGAYPTGSEWDWAEGGDSEGAYEKVWSVALPKNDPVLGQSTQGLNGLWQT